LVKKARKRGAPFEITDGDEKETKIGKGSGGGILLPAKGGFFSKRKRVASATSSAERQWASKKEGRIPS